MQDLDEKELLKLHESELVEALVMADKALKRVMDETDDFDLCDYVEEVRLSIRDLI